MPDDFLLRMEILASCNPCSVPKADMLRLVGMAGFDPSHLAHSQVQASGDPVLALRDGVLHLIAMARGLAGEG